MKIIFKQRQNDLFDIILNGHNLGDIIEMNHPKSYTQAHVALARTHLTFEIPLNDMDITIECDNPELPYPIDKLRNMARVMVNYVNPYLINSETINQISSNKS